MFDIKNHDRIVELVDGRLKSSYVEPLYVKIYNNIYGLDELDVIDDFNPSAFKVGFGSSLGLFIRKPIDMRCLISLDVVDKFKMYKEELQCEHVYYVFETGQLIQNDPSHETFKEFFEQIDYYYWLLRDHIEERYSIIKKKRMEELLKGME
jgi:poly-D-alanine transfer protein DltD